jgi:translation initiation factor 1
MAKINGKFNGQVKGNGLDALAGLVYSSEGGQACPDCNKTIGSCICSDLKGEYQGDGVAKIRRETSGRKGKGVIVIWDIPLHAKDLPQISSDLKKSIGSGGSLKNGKIEIQGEKLEQVRKFFEKKGFKVKQVGG